MILRRNSRDIFLAIFIGLVAVALVLLHLNTGIFGIILGVLLVLLVPGYVLSTALFPESNWSLMERIVLSIGLSLALSILGGILLYALSIHLNAETWAAFYGFVITAAGFWAVFRRMQLQRVPARRKSDTTPIRRGLVMPRPWQLVLFGLATVILLGAIILDRNYAAIYPKTEIVQMWLLPGDPAPGPNVRLGAMANEYAPAEYSLWLERGGYTVQTWHHLTLTPGQNWEVVVPVDPNMPGSGPLEAFLYRLDQPTIPYRHVILWLDQLQNKQ